MSPRSDHAGPSATHSAASIQLEERLRARHITFSFEPNLRIDTIIQAEGHQVRLIEHRAPTDLVKRYAEQMKAGAVFPAIVVNELGELIDGNTRRLAGIKAGRTTLAAYVCAGLSPLQARALSVELNQCHGLSMTEDEIRAFVIGAVQEGQDLDAKSYARITGVRASTLARWKAQALFQKRAERCGISLADVRALSQSTQAVLNTIRLTPLFVAVTELALAAKMSTADARTLATRVNAAGSEADALALVTAERDLRHADIRAIASGFAGPRRTGRYAMHIAALMKVEPDELLNAPPEQRDQAIQRLKALRDRIEEALSRADAQSAHVAPSGPVQDLVVAAAADGAR